ncbi:MAG: hypothetical protein RX316_08070 [bacterium]|nr:hypothetical protein [bacterium]
MGPGGLSSRSHSKHTGRPEEARHPEASQASSPPSRTETLENPFSLIVAAIQAAEPSPGHVQ